MTDEPPEDAPPDDVTGQDEEQSDAPATDAPATDDAPTDDAPTDDAPESAESATDLTEDERASWQPTRRRLLQGTAVSAALAGLGGLAFAQDGDPLDAAETIVLGGETQAWQGRDPESINGESNPTLNLQVGDVYDLTWENVDGLPHNFAILDADGNVLESTEIIDEQGATQSVSFAVTEEMAEYFCEVHPTSMRGDIETRGAQETPSTPGEGTPTEGTPGATESVVPQGPSIGLQKVAGDPLTQPVSFETAGEDPVLRYVADQTGQVYVHTEDGIQEEPFLDISERLVQNPEQRGGFDERGLLGIAFHPNFSENGRFFVRYSGTGQDRELPEDYDHMFMLSEFQAGEDRTSADPESEQVLLEIPEPQFNHNAGYIAFGPDDSLYVGTGDGGGADDTGLGHVNDWYQQNDGGNGQDVTQNLLGSILRIDVDGQETIRGEERPYGIPEDNPLVGTEGLDEQWAWGFRNPWRMSFNRGELIAADVGQNLWEEIDHVVKGGNYGWNVREGFHCFSTEQPSNPQAITECPTNAPDQAPYNGQPLVQPLLEYPHQAMGEPVGISVTGGFVYFNDTVSELTDQYVFGDWSASFAQPMGRLWVADLDVDFGDAADGTGTPAGTETEADGTAAGTATPADTPAEGEPMETAAGTPGGTGTEADGTDTEMAGTETPAEGTPMETPAGTETEMAGTATEVAGTPGEGTPTPTPGERGETATPGGEAEQAPDFAMQELVVEGAEGGRLDRSVLAFGRDVDGELYVLTSTTTTVDGLGEVFKIVPPGDGEEIAPAPTPTPAGTPAGTETETAGTETEDTGTETEVDGTETEAAATETDMPAEGTETEMPAAGTETEAAGTETGTESM